MLTNAKFILIAALLIQVNSFDLNHLENTLDGNQVTIGDGEDWNGELIISFDRNGVPIYESDLIDGQTIEPFELEVFSEDVRADIQIRCCISVSFGKCTITITFTICFNIQPYIIGPPLLMPSPILNISQVTVGK